MKKIILLVILSFFSLTIFAQNNLNSKSIISFRNAQAAYENKEYGKALKYAEDAILYKKEQLKADYDAISTSISAREVKNAGDNILSIIPVLTNRDEYDVINLINYYNSKGQFDNSITKILAYIKSHEEYPEAQKLIGDIYKIEGEYSFAEQYYLKALENSEVLDIPDERYEIIYLLADLSRLSGDYELMEIRLLNIIGKEQNQTNMTLARSMRNTVSKNDEAAIEKFFTMYRAQDYFCLRAFYELAQYYYSINEFDKAFDYSAVAVITGFTKIYNVVSKRDIDFEYVNLQDFLDLVSLHNDIVKWGNDNEVWRSFNLFCEICNECGYTKFSYNLLTILAFHSPQQYWQQDAVLKLDKLDGIKNPE